MDIKKLLENKLFRILALAVVGVIFLVIIIVIVMSARGKRLTGYEALEEKLISVAKEYYQDNQDQLPKEIGGKVEVQSTTLTQEKYMKDIAKISPKGATCNGRVVVKNVNQKYFYQAFVDCGEDHQTTTLSNYVKKNEQIVSSGSGLYENNGSYIYRGELLNNYLKFAGRLYRIVQFNHDGTVQIISTERTERIVWDDRYNQDREENSGINDYRLSRVRDTLLNRVNSDAFSDVDRNMLEPFGLCVGKVLSDAPVALGSECSDVLDGQVIGLLPVSSYVYASLDASCKTPLDGTCQNYNYLVSNYNWWTATGDITNTYKTFVVQMSGSLYNTRSSSEAVVREVLRLTENVVYVSGNGSLENPYIIK